MSFPKKQIEVGDQILVQQRIQSSHRTKRRLHHFISAMMVGYKLFLVHIHIHIHIQHTYKHRYIDFRILYAGVIIYNYIRGAY